MNSQSLKLQPWKNKDAFILGGGSSLRDWDIDVLKGERVVGVNDAYIHGPYVCDVCVFGDFKWYKVHFNGLVNYAKNGGCVVTNCPQTVNERFPWLYRMGREARGLHHNALGWNTNTGSSALNLALILGAKTVYLLGFDMKLGLDGRSNWHNGSLDTPNPAVYTRMLGKDKNDNFVVVKKHLEVKFPDRIVINVTSDSDLDMFPKVDFETFWKERS
ncbi:MAG TPA: hypothetical protein VMW91_01515 [Desulfosporosinus sp.]|nr:hypothetical protein [Desulfosporosinus sp.]